MDQVQWQQHPTSRIYFVRHGETEKNAEISDREDVFSAEGLKQVGRLTKKLTDLGIVFDNIYVSPLWRTKETIRPFLASHKDSYRSVDDYLEDNIAECCWDAAHDKTAEVHQSAEKMSEYIRVSQKPVNILIVSHYHSGRILLKKLVGVDTEPKNADLMVFDAFPQIQQD
jgi:broad specificity phosphatase PhoE